MNYWLIKSEPSCFSIHDLKRLPDQTTPWDGVRNYQARNYIRKMQVGDYVFFYHSNCNPPEIVGIVEVVKEAYPDHTAFDPNSEHPCLKSTRDKPRWFMVDVQFKQQFKQPIPLNALKQHPELLKMPLVQKGNRLSVMPITPQEWHFIMNTWSEH